MAASLKDVDGLKEKGSRGRETETVKVSSGTVDSHSKEKMESRQGASGTLPGGSGFDSERERVLDWRAGHQVEMTPQLLPPQGVIPS